MFPKPTVLPSWPEPWPQMPFPSFLSWLTPTHPWKCSFDITCSRKPSLNCHLLNPQSCMGPPLCLYSIQGCEWVSECEVNQLWPTFCDTMDCSPPGFSAHGIFRQEYWSGLPFPSSGDLPVSLSYWRCLLISFSNQFQKLLLTKNYIYSLKIPLSFATIVMRSWKRVLLNEK